MQRLSVQLSSWQCIAQYSCIRKMTYKPSKLGQADLVFGLWSEFISRSVLAGLQVSMQRIWYVSPWL